ncbi:MAG: YafY family transcriptional regulator [Chloroflexota bacterium]|nr:YafY family transcriptional regulator [Chloroflexota bacterium]
MRADRLLSMLMVLQIKGHATAHELAERLEVSERTIYRDLEALSSAGVPVYTERGPGGGCVLAEGYRTNLTGLTESEVRTLFMSGVPALLANLELGRSLEAALLKLLATLPTSHRSGAEHARQRIHLDPVAWGRAEEEVPHMRAIQEGIWQDRRLLLTYRKGDGSIVERLIDPLGLVAKASIWYLVGTVAGQMRVFRVSRTQDARLTDEPSQRPQDFDLPAFWKQWSHDFEASWPRYPVTFRADPRMLPSLPQMYGEGMHEIIKRAGPADKDGWVTLHMTFESLEMARGSMLSLGTWVEVLSPQELREHVIDFARGIVEFYEQP